ncbi:hypothetical protein JCM6882_004832 [Rhodosporidiobolus microsporus]
MALVSSSPAPSTPLYPASSPLFAPAAPSPSSSSSSSPSSPNADPAQQRVRALPSPPLAAHQNQYLHQGGAMATYASQVSGGGGRKTSSGSGSATGGARAPPAAAPLPAPQPTRARTSSAPYATTTAPSSFPSSSPTSADGGASAGAQFGGRSPLLNGAAAPLPPPVRVPSRSSSTPPNAAAAASQSAPSSTRPSPTPSPGARSLSSSSVRSFHQHHGHSPSSSSVSSAAGIPAVPALPRLAPAHFSPPLHGNAPLPPFYPQHPSQQHQPPSPSHSPSMPALAAHPTFVGMPGQPFPHGGALGFGGVPNPAYPFIPSPHPNGPGATSVEQQKRLAQYQQQWQFEVMKQQQAQQAQQQQANDQWAQQNGQRRRATSGPQSASHSPTYYTSPLPLPYPPSPSANNPQPQALYGPAMPTLPPGAMLPHQHYHQQQLSSFGVGVGGYPTPPGSVEGAGSAGRGGGRDESGSSSGGSGTGSAGRQEGGYHPYRRDGGGRSTGGGGAAAASGMTGRAGTPSRHLNQHQHSLHQQQQHQQHARSESTASVSALAPSNFPPLPSSSAPTSTSTSASAAASAASSGRNTPSTSGPSASASSSTSSFASPSSAQPQPPSFPRARTDSANSSASSSSACLHRPSFDQQQQQQRHPRESYETARSATPVQQTLRGRPSPLGVAANGEETEEGEDTGAESDGTAEATATINAPSVAAAAASGRGMVQSETITSMAETIGKGRNGAAAVVAAPVAAAEEKGKEKEKKGMKSRFKKAFGVSFSASSSSNLASAAAAGGSGSDLEVDGRGPKQLNGGFRRRTDSASSDETTPGTPQRAAPLPYATHHHQPSMASLASTSTAINDAESTRTGAGGAGKKPPSSRFRLLNPKLNSSTDNISISSTVSSASVMIRKLGQMGKLARRNSLMGLTKAFKKDKNRDDANESTFDAQSTMSGATGGSSGMFGGGGKKDKKKSQVASASVSHATAEYDSPSFSSSSVAGSSSSMSPAAALARKQQLAYAEQDAAEAAARAAAAEEAARLGPPSRSFEQIPAGGGGGGGHARTDSDASSVRSAGGRLEGKKDKAKGGRWKLGFGGGNGSKTDVTTASAETGSINEGRSSSALGHNGAAAGGRGYYAPNGDDGTEVLAPPGSQGYSSYAARAGEDSQDEYEPSLYRQGAAPRPAAHVKAVKGILKGAGTYRQEDHASQRLALLRGRASSFDAPQQQARPGSPGGAALVNVIPSEAQVDGVVPSSTSPRTDTHPPTSTEIITDAAIARVHPDSDVGHAHHHPGGGPYANPGLNASAPVLNHFTSQLSVRSASAPGAPGRRIAFAANLSVHTTWPAAIYDRRAEPATCNRLTPALAQQIKEELNSYKMEEMDVHPSSRKLTHFFV